MVHIFIVNPFAGRRNYVEALRKELESIEGLNYFVFNTRYMGYESEIVEKILHFFDDEKIRFYSCGGSGTLNRILNGIEDLSSVEIAFYPCGLTNDFLKVFGEKQALFNDIENLINGTVVKIDYIKTNHGIALNSMSTGADADYGETYERYRFANGLSGAIPKILGIINALILHKPQEYEIEVDGEALNDKYSEIVFLNGKCLGGTFNFTDNLSIQDGIGFYSFAKFRGVISLIPIIIRSANHQYEKLGSQAMSLR